MHEVWEGSEVPLGMVADKHVEDGELGDAGHNQEHVDHGHVHLQSVVVIDLRVNTSPGIRLPISKSTKKGGIVMKKF